MAAATIHGYAAGSIWGMMVPTRKTTGSAMKYRRSDAKDHARAHMKGIWAAALMHYAPDLSIDEKGLRKNLRQWVDDLGIDGVFIAGKQSEFFSMSIAERKRSMEIVVDEIGTTSGVIASCSAQNMAVVIELAKHAQAIGSPYIVVHAPVLPSPGLHAQPHPRSYA